MSRAAALKFKGSVWIWRKEAVRMRVTITLKRIRITISSKAVGSCESVIADARLLREPLHKEFPSFFKTRTTPLKKAAPASTKSGKAAKPTT